MNRVKFLQGSGRRGWAAPVFAVAAVLTGIVPSFGGANATTLYRLTRGPSTEADPCFSPDGRQIVYLKDDQITGNRELWVMPETGEPPVLRLTTQNLDPVWPTWSPDGSSIVFVSPNSLMKVSSAGGAPVRLTPQGGRHPTWSPDGLRVAFSSENTGGIWAVPASGGSVSLLTDRSLGRKVDPTFSPDGGRVAFASDKSGHLEIYVQAVDGGPEMQLTAMKGMNLEPAWSPDGRWIAFSRLSGPHRGIWAVEANGGSAVCVTCSGYQDGTPNWSPDGRSLVFDRHVSDNNDDVWMATNLSLAPAAPIQTTWGRIKAQFR